MPVQQCVFDFETGVRESGIVLIYAYFEIPKNEVVYIGQTVDLNERHSGHLSGWTEFDAVFRSRPNDFTKKVIDKVRDVPGGPCVTARELELIDEYGTWIELGVGYNRRVIKTWRQRAADYFKNASVTVDDLGGEGPFALVRECPRWHKKGEHWNWYRHIVYELYRTEDEAVTDSMMNCGPLPQRQTEMDVACDVSKHSIVHFYWDRKDRTWKTKLIIPELADDADDELIPF